jgi:uncharacterized protein YndB with AHSA1/START domain
MTRHDAPVRPLHASIDIAATPDAVWRVVSDVRRTREWSPECRRVVPVRGSWLLGFNRRGRTRWVTLSQIITSVPGREIAWRVVTNGSVWSYRLSPGEAGTRLVETREAPDGVGRVAAWFTRAFLSGQATHDDELEAGMQTGLQRIKTVVES